MRVGTKDSSGLGSLSCPSCGSGLNEQKDKLICSACSKSYSIVNGIPYFLKEETFWSEPGITPNILQGIIEDLDHRNWHDVFLTHESEAVSQHYSFIKDLGRARWHSVLGLERESIILDLGAGMGTITDALARQYQSLYAVEPVELRCQFMKRRFDQENIKNATIVRTDSTSLPFRSEFFDHIAMNGVLEWIPYSYKDLNPRKAQILVLRKLKELLKIGGSISIGIENRFNHSFFLGVPDCHIGVKYVTLMPRYLAHLVCRFAINDIYRPYIYSFRGLRRLLLDAGFCEITIYASLPSYNEPSFTIKLNAKDERLNDLIWPTKNPISLNVKRLLRGLGILKYLGYAFRAVAFRK
jgi:protein-L-isoaspartate O-methyltransferase/uncharacterized protein YbaR (Trm112 family)